MLGLIILANGFEDTEAFATIDVLKRAKIKVTTATINNDLNVISQYNQEIKANALLQDVVYQDYDVLIIPGGKAVYNHLLNNAEVDNCIKYFKEANKLIAAICAGPMVLGKNGVLKDLEYTCFPSCEEGLDGFKVDKNVVATKKVITARSMYYSIDFGLEIVKNLLGEEVKNKVLNSTKGIAN